MTQDTEKVLVELLQQIDSRGERMEARQSTLMIEQAETKGHVIALDAKLTSVADACKARHEQNSRRIDGLEDDQEKTGQHELATLREQVKDAQESSKHWVRYVVGVVVGLITSGGAVALLQAFSHK